MNRITSRPAMKVWALLVLLLLCAGCTRKFDMSQMNLRTNLNGQNEKLIIAVQDQREDIVSGSEEPDYIGVDAQKGILDIMPDIKTSNGRTLAEALTLRIASGLRRDGYEVEPLVIPHTDKTPLEQEELKSGDFDKFLFVKLVKFKGSTQNPTKTLNAPPYYTQLEWDLTLDLFDSSMQQLAEVTESGLDKNLHKWQAFGIVSMGKAQKAVLDKTSAILIKMMRAPEVRPLLEQAPRPEPAPPAEGQKANSPAKTAVGHEGSEADAETSALPAEVAELRTLLEQKEEARFQNNAKALHLKGVDDRRVLDGLCQLVWDKRYSTDPKVLDGLCYICRIIDGSGDGRYKEFLLSIYEEQDLSRKLRKYAKRMSQSLPDNADSTFRPETEETGL